MFTVFDINERVNIMLLLHNHLDMNLRNLRTTLCSRMYMQGGVCISDTRLDGKIAIVTGANVGLGKETVIDFVKRGNTKF